MNFKEAYEKMREGKKVRRKDWLGYWFIEDGKVKMIAKKVGLKNSMRFICESLIDLDCDPNYEIIPSMTYNKKNLDLLKGMTDEKFYPQMKVIDDLDHAIAAHWGPNAFGYIFVKK